MRAPTGSPGATLFAVSVAHFLMPFMMSGVGVALPSLGRDLGGSAAQLGLVETAYVLSASVFLLAMGRAGDIHGRRRVFEWGIGVFTAVGGALSQARTIEAVIALRFLQGAGGAMIAATGMAIVVAVFPPEQRGRALGVSVASVYAGLSCGPFVGGLLVTAFGWRSLFYLCVPLGIGTLVLLRATLRGEWAEARGEPFDWPGALAWGSAILLLIVGATSLGRGPWSWGVAAAGMAAGAAFLALEARTAHPLLDVGLLRRNPVFALSNLAALLNYAATFGVTFYLSLYLQYVKGMSPREAGLVLVLQPLAQALLSPACGRLADRWAPGRVATAGMALCAAGLGAAATISEATSVGFVRGVLLVLGTGFALFSSPNTSAIMGSVPPRQLGVASGLAATMRTLGMLASMTVVTVVSSAVLGSRAVTADSVPAFVLSLRVGLAAFCVFCAVGIGCSLGRLRPAAGPQPAAEPGSGGGGTGGEGRV